jgi:hypothetical protein
MICKLNHALHQAEDFTGIENSQTRTRTRPSAPPRRHPPHDLSISLSRPCHRAVSPLLVLTCARCAVSLLALALALVVPILAPLASPSLSSTRVLENAAVCIRTPALSLPH